MLSLALSVCAVCKDELGAESGACCGRCQRIVCRVCSAARGRTHESVLCADCQGLPRPAGFRNTTLYRSWRRLRLGQG